MKRPLAALAALALGIGLAAAAVPMAASAHTGDLNATAVCQTDGTYKVTYTLTISKTDLTGTTNWKVGTSTFEGTPTSDAGLSGAIASDGAGTITLGTTTVPGNSTSAPWAYAFTTWSDEFTKGSDGGNIELAGTCTPPDSATASYKLNVAAATCDAAGSASITELTHATLAAPLDTTPGDHTATVNADKGFTFADGSKTQQVPYTVPAQVTGLPCYPPATCVATGTHDTEAGDLAPSQTAAGLLFDGPTAVGQAKDVYYRVSSGNAQGITGMSVTYGDTSTEFPAQVVVEILRTGTSGFATLSTNLSAAQAVGTVDIQNSGTWYTNKIASGPGSLAWVSTGNTETFADLIANYPANKLLSAPSLHLQSNSTSASHSLVTHLASSCGSFSYVPTKPEPVTRHTTVTSEPVCDYTNGGGTSTTTTTYYETDYTFDAESGTYVLGEEFQVGEPLVVTNQVDGATCPIHVTLVNPTVTTVGCGLNQSVVLPPADNQAVSYSILASDLTGATVLATPGENAQLLTAGTSWVTNEDGTASFVVKYAAVVTCPTTSQLPPTTALLAHTGTDAATFNAELALGISLGTAGLALLGLMLGLRIYRRRTDALVDPTE